MGPIWGRQDPGGPHVGPINLAIWNGSQLAGITIMWLVDLNFFKSRLSCVAIPCGLTWPVRISTVFQRSTTVPLHNPNGRQMSAIRAAQGAHERVYQVNVPSQGHSWQLSWYPAILVIMIIIIIFAVVIIVVIVVVAVVGTIHPSIHHLPLSSSTTYPHYHPLS